MLCIVLTNLYAILYDPIYRLQCIFYVTLRILLVKASFSLPTLFSCYGLFSCYFHVTAYFHVITSSFVVFNDRSPITWKSKKQSVISCSSTEAQSCAVAHTIILLAWLHRLLLDSPLPMKLTCDDKITFQIAPNPVFMSGQNISI